MPPIFDDYRNNRNDLLANQTADFNESRLPSLKSLLGYGIAGTLGVGTAAGIYSGVITTASALAAAVTAVSWVAAAVHVAAPAAIGIGVAAASLYGLSKLFGAGSQIGSALKERFLELMPHPSQRRIQDEAQLIYTNLSHENREIIQDHEDDLPFLRRVTEIETNIVDGIEATLNQVCLARGINQNTVQANRVDAIHELVGIAEGQIFSQVLDIAVDQGPNSHEIQDFIHNSLQQLSNEFEQILDPNNPI